MTIVRWFHRAVVMVLFASLLVHPQALSARQPSATDYAAPTAPTAASVTPSPWQLAGIDDPEQLNDADRFERATIAALNGQADPGSPESRRNAAQPARRSTNQEQSGDLAATVAGYVRHLARFQRIEAEAAQPDLAPAAAGRAGQPLLAASAARPNQVLALPGLPASLIALDGLVEVDIPAGAVSEPTLLSYAAAPPPASSPGMVAVGSFFHLTARTTADVPVV